MSKAPTATEYQLATGFLKRRLRTLGISYAELAQGVGLSESGLKKILNARDASFGRLSKICRYAGLSLGELLKEGEGEVLELSYSDAQEQALLAKPELFRFYWCLVYERAPLQELREDFGINESFRLLRELDRLQLLKLLPGDRVRLPPVRPVRWVGKGPLVRELYKKWSRRMVDELATPDESPGAYFLLRYLKMSAQSYDDFLSALRRLEEDFVRRAVREMRTQSVGLRHVRWMTCVDQRRFV
jgi:transcriptional regulator with XRE-family HTH domain